MTRPPAGSPTHARSPFFFEGRIPTSKSLLNRALILRSYASGRLLVQGGSDAEDVSFLRKSLGKIEDGKEFYLGDGGTTLRFFALRAAREKGTFTLKVSERLFRRPQGALGEILASLGARWEAGHNQFILRSSGWILPEGRLKIPTGESSQFASAVVLNAWGLPWDLRLSFDGAMTSESYFRMTLALCREAGMEIQEETGGLTIPAGQTIRVSRLALEPDVSSLFSIATLAALNGEARFLDLPEKILQPDMRFVDLLRAMGVPVSREGARLEIHQAPFLKPLTAQLGDAPDLVPVLSVLCAFAPGRSSLRGAPQLRHKESDRVRSTANLLRAMGVGVTEFPDGLEIEGRADRTPRSFDFDPDKDHRLAMAAGILIAMGWNIRLHEPEVVAKSFPEFWSVLRAGPHLVIGHRGVGKTSLIRRQGETAVDLDAEIERTENKDIFTLFRDRGEEVFRGKEITNLREVLATAAPSTWIAAGAGLRLSEAVLPADVLWVRRDTDRDGRVFLDRPRLDPGSDPLGEFRQRAKAREPLYERHARRVYTIPEGLEKPDAIERKILDGDLRDVGGAVTMLPFHRATLPQLGAELYEIRDDLLEPDDVHSLFHKVPEEKILYSIRRHQQIPAFVRASNCRLDWGLDGSYPEKELVEELAPRLILSSHGTLKDALLDFRLFTKFDVHLKLSPPIESYEELMAGHAWWSQDPSRRTFLPRSSSGRWAWYRLWMKGRMKLNFWREGGGSALDQPTLWQWLATPWAPGKFAAVLGSPVAHSWTPTEHKDFFAAADLPVFAIDLREGEWHLAFPFLRALGLRYAAVTSPLKGRAFRACDQVSKLAREMASVNTLVFDETTSEWRGHNTDLEGLVEAVRALPEADAIAVWGGGGTLPVLGRVLPRAAAFSSTGGHLRKGSRPLEGLPEILVWAAPRGSDLRWPPDDWRPTVVLDLNYKEDSPGREYALRCKAQYISGAVMFRAQAQGQRDFWRTFLTASRKDL